MLTIKCKPSVPTEPPMSGEVLAPAKQKKKRRTHVAAEPYSGSGDFTIANWMFYLELSHSAVHAHLKPTCKRRRLPQPDGSAPFTWMPETAWEYLKKYLSRSLERRGITPPA